ncbi:hypothetical protein [Cohnella caldifontis]|uniref:hypothetical protein n=1 Tax=Cohnella caldifontis TaxID=3027471 RepID=UPI0023ED8EB6|nr:hypothetical protein [Cohnella sp. YIM B05605]
MNRNPLNQLAFLSGAWQGDGFIADFTEPVYNLMFGSMQVAGDNGTAAYWETYRFEARNDKVFVYPAQMGRENGAYLLQENDPADPEAGRKTFRSFIDKQASIQEISFESARSGEELRIGVAGSTERGAIRKEWVLSRRSG